jgi:hypothetical protein
MTHNRVFWLFYPSFLMLQKSFFLKQGGSVRPQNCYFKKQPYFFNVKIISRHQIVIRGTIKKPVPTYIV